MFILFLSLDILSDKMTCWRGADYINLLLTVAKWYSLLRLGSAHPMSENPPSPTRIRIGSFELDIQTGDLRQGTIKAKLQEQPREILAMLLEHPGEVVTREELRRRLWPDHTFVDFDHGLNRAINKLREALGDTADKPRFIETIPRHGYRFMGPVEWHRPLTLSSESRETHAFSHSDGEGGQVNLPVAIRKPRLRRRTIVMATGGMVLAVLGVLITLNVAGLRDRALRTVGAIRDPPLHIHSIAVLPLENLSRDPEQEYFADSMTEELITHLGKASGLRIISRASVMPYKHTKAPLRQIARELNVDALVKGAVLRSGDRVRITAQLIQPKPERHLWADSYERDLCDMLALQDEVARAIVDGITVTLQPPDGVGRGNAGPVNPTTVRR